jgi:hypothetical protein
MAITASPNQLGMRIKIFIAEQCFLANQWTRTIAWLRHFDTIVDLLAVGKRHGSGLGDLLAVVASTVSLQSNGIVTDDDFQTMDPTRGQTKNATMNPNGQSLALGDHFF